MPYLNWRDLTELELKQAVSAIAGMEESSAQPMEMRLTLSASAAGTLTRALEECLGPASSGELRLELPRGWIVFWKKRESESRLLVAHPQPEEWVATVALAPEHAIRLLEDLSALATSEMPEAVELRAGGNLRLKLEGMRATMENTS